MHHEMEITLKESISAKVKSTASYHPSLHLEHGLPEWIKFGPAVKTKTKRLYKPVLP